MAAETDTTPSARQAEASASEVGAVHPAVKLWRMAAFLDGEEGMDKLAWFARLTQSDPGRRYFGRVCSQFPEYHDKLWSECSPDLKRFHAGQEFIHDTGMSWDEASPPDEPQTDVTVVALSAHGQGAASFWRDGKRTSDNGCCSSVEPCSHQRQSPNTLCETCALAVQVMPTAWMRGHRTPSSPHGPAEYDVDLVYGDDQPEGEGWLPLYAAPQPAAARGQGAGATVPGIYMASKAVHGPRWRKLRDAGWPIISTWIDEAEAGRTTDWADLWDRCATEPARAAVTVLYAKEGETLKGALAEIGAALSHGRKVIVVGPVDHTWTKHRNVHRAADLTEARELWMPWLTDLRLAAPRPEPAPAETILRDLVEAGYDAGRRENRDGIPAALDRARVGLQFTPARDGQRLRPEDIEAAAMALWRLEHPEDDDFSAIAPNDWARWPETPKEASLAYVEHSREEYREQVHVAMSSVGRTVSDRDRDLYDSGYQHGKHIGSSQERHRRSLQALDTGRDFSRYAKDPKAMDAELAAPARDGAPAALGGDGVEALIREAVAVARNNGPQSDCTAAEAEEAATQRALDAVRALQAPQADVAGLLDKLTACATRNGWYRHPSNPSAEGYIDEGVVETRAKIDAAIAALVRRADGAAAGVAVSADLRALSEAATPGLWTMADGDNRPGCIVGVSTNPAISSPDVVLSATYSDRSHAEDRANMELALRAVNDLRARIEAADRPAGGADGREG